MGGPKVNPEIRARYRRSEVFNLLEAFFEKRVGEHLPREISFEKEIEKRTAEILRQDRETGIVAVGLCQLKNQFLFIYRVLETKLAYLSGSMIHAINTDNHLLLALCCRSLLEHAGSISYLIERTRKSIEALRNQRESSAIKQRLEELQLIFRKMFYGTKFFKDEGLVQAIHVNDLIDKYLANEMAGARDAYNYLSDFVHPNFGSNVLVSSGALGDGIIDPPIEEKREIVEAVLRITEQIIRYLDFKVWDFAAFALVFDDYLNRAIHPSGDLHRVFVEAKPRWEGDGRTKETGILFTNALTHVEHIEMQKKYLESADVRCTGPRGTVAVDAEFIYDMYPTAEGGLWFRVPRDR